MTIKFGQVVTYHEELLLIKLHELSITCFCEITGYIKYFIPSCIRSMAIKYGKVVTLREKLPPINSHNPLNMCSREVS